MILPEIPTKSPQRSPQIIPSTNPQNNNKHKQYIKHVESWNCFPPTLWTRLEPYTKALLNLHETYACIGRYEALYTHLQVGRVCAPASMLTIVPLWIYTSSENSILKQKDRSTKYAYSISKLWAPWEKHCAFSHKFVEMKPAWNQTVDRIHSKRLCLWTWHLCNI